MIAPLGARYVETVVIGSGVAGLSAALGLEQYLEQGLGRCTVVTGDELSLGGSSPLAQGGVAAAIADGDTPAAHGADTVAVAGGVADPSVVDLVVGGGPRAIDELIEYGAALDRDPDGGLALGREAGHSARRIVHGNGDATGAVVMSALHDAIRERPEIEVLEHTTAVDLIRSRKGAVAGVLVVDRDGRHEALLADAVVLATGGYAHCFDRTTTPEAVIGTGVAMAARAGATVVDMEFVQFHPTALDVTAAGRLPLLTEALRGEGAVLANRSGDRYLRAEHPDAELAPRDVVARANYRQLQSGHRPALDAREAVGDAFPDRFPTVFGLAMEHGLDPRVEPLPVTPAAHYCMGGVAVDRNGRTSLDRLWAVGEVASTGLHGANRLASNSLLEGLVMGRRVAESVRRHRSTTSGRTERLWAPARPTLGDDDALVRTLRRAIWAGAGVERDERGLRACLEELDGLVPEIGRGVVARTVHTVGRLVATAALSRTESRGAHYRRDHPGLDPGQARRRTMTPLAMAVEPLAVTTARPASRLLPAS